MFARQSRQAEISAEEAANLNALAHYSVCYGSLLMLGLLGFMALLIALGMPVYGRTGALEIFGVLSRLCSAGLFLVALYAAYCYLHGNGKVSPSTGLQLFLLSVVFWLAGLNHMDSGISVTELLLWFGQVCPSCGSIL
ncbi:MAG: hypothetical protein V4634_04230 [Pseudomonadota bacterium]